MRFVTKERLVEQRWLSKDEAKSIRQFEADEADPSQEETVTRLLKEAHDKGWWLECDCNEERRRYPLVSPVLRDKALYWRMITGPGRLAHSEKCCFHQREVRRKHAANWSKARRKPPEGFFSVLKPTGGTEAKKSVGGGASVKSTSGGQLPAIAKMLHSLLEKAGLNRWYYDRPERNISSEYAALRQVGSCVKVAPGVLLRDVFFTYAPDWPKNIVFKRMREKMKDWPDGHRPQGFVCYFCHEVDQSGATVRVKGEEIHIPCAGTVKYPVINGNQVSGPYLFFGVLAETSKKSGLEIQRAYAQPIADFNHFLAIDSEFERKAFNTLQFTLKRLSTEYGEYTWWLEKPLFEMGPDDEPCLPDFLVKARHRENHQEMTFVVEVMGFDRPSYLAGKEITHPRMEKFGPLIEMQGKNFTEENPSGDGRKVTEYILHYMSVNGS